MVVIGINSNEREVKYHFLKKEIGYDELLNITWDDISLIENSETILKIEPLGLDITENDIRAIKKYSSEYLRQEMGIREEYCFLIDGAIRVSSTLNNYRKEKEEKFQDKLKEIGFSYHIPRCWNCEFCSETEVTKPKKNSMKKAWLCNVLVSSGDRTFYTSSSGACNLWSKSKDYKPENN